MIFKIKPKKKWSAGGVSDVVGNILLLSITVVLFSSVIMMVYQMPVPNERSTADFKAELNFITDTSAYLNITHNGGEPLFDYSTRIYVYFENDSSMTYQLSDGGVSSSSWIISTKWSELLTDITTSAKVDVRIIDIDVQATIWAGTVSGGQGTLAPIILQRWVDADTTTATADLIRESDTAFTFFVRVDDPDYDLNTSGVWIDASVLPSGDSHMDHTGSVTGGIWEFVFDNIESGQALNYDGKPLFIHALDEAGHETIEVFQLKVLQPDVSTTIYEGDVWETPPAETGEGGLPSWMLYQGAGHGYVILGENTSARPPWGNLANTSDPKTTFTQGEEWIFIRVGSTSLSNLLGNNDLTIINRLSGEPVIPPSNSSAFSRLFVSGNAYVYEAKFNSSLFAPGAYDAVIDLQSSLSEGGIPVHLFMTANLTILPQADQEGIFVPEIKIYKDDDRNPSDEWGTVSDPFDLSNVSTSVVWVEITMQDAGAGTSVSIEEVRIKDFRGHSNLYGTPPTTTSDMLGENQSDLATKYYFSIDLRLKNGVNWQGGLAAYSLTVSNIFDANEGVYTISMPIWVQSPASMHTYISGTSGIGVGNVNFAHFEYLFQTEQNKFFTTRTLEEKDESPGVGGASLNVYNLIFFDMDEDGDRDILAAIFDRGVGPLGSHTLGIYINRLNEYGIWERRNNLDEYTDGDGILSMAYGDVDLDGDLDWVVAGESTANTLGGNVYLYKNDFPIIQTKLFSDSEDHGFVEMRLTDVTGDGKADLIVLDCGDNVAFDETTTARGASDARMRMYDISTGTPDEIANVPTIGDIKDFDVADIDGDDDFDLAVVTDSATYGVRWYERTQTLTSAAVATGEQTNVGTKSGTYTDTQSSDDTSESIQESSGDLEHIWTVETISGTKPTVYIETRVSSGADEGFYYYFSSASDSGPWTFMFIVTSTVTSDTDYSFPLPLGTSGTIYIRVIDASSLGSSDDTIYIDMINVKGIEEIDFTLHQLTSNSTYVAIGIGDFTGSGNLDVAVGKSGLIMVVDGSTGNPISYIADADLNPNGDTFEVTDVNDDGRTDIVSVKDYDGVPIIVYEWLNQGSGTTFYGIEIKNINMFVAGTDAPDFSGEIQYLSVENPYG